VDDNRVNNYQIAALNDGEKWWLASPHHLIYVQAILAIEWERYTFSQFLS
jgi:hypothetical protein